MTEAEKAENRKAAEALFWVLYGPSPEERNRGVLTLFPREFVRKKTNELEVMLQQYAQHAMAESKTEFMIPGCPIRFMLRPYQLSLPF